MHEDPLVQCDFQIAFRNRMEAIDRHWKHLRPQERVRIFKQTADELRPRDGDATEFNIRAGRIRTYLRID